MRRLFSLILHYISHPKITDLLLWPVAGRLFKKYSTIIDITPGIPIRVYGDMQDMVNKSLLFYSDYIQYAWEPATAKLVTILAPKKQVVVTAGSHIGYYPVIIAHKNPDAKIYAFEPNPKNFARLKENVKDLPNVEAVPCGLGDKIEDKKMFFDFGQSSFIETNRVHDGEGVVHVETLDNFFKDKNAPDLFILDAEGYEEFILRGGAEIVKKYHPDIIFEINKTLSHDTLTEYIKGLGYNIQEIEGDHGRFINALATV